MLVSINSSIDFVLMVLVLDSWGKIPSGFLSGNLYELGDFSECLNIERSGKRFKTQYCLGQLLFDVGSRKSTYNSLQMNNYHLWQMEEMKKTVERMLLMP